MGKDYIVGTRIEALILWNISFLHFLGSFLLPALRHAGVVLRAKYQAISIREQYIAPKSYSRLEPS